MCNKINYIKEYKCKEYPFKCDFYFPDKNLYLEIQGFWSHGGHPFDPNNEDDIEKANCWKEKGSKLYLNNYNVWTIRDPLKREIAKKNNLNLIEVFTTDINVLIDKVKKLL